MEDKDLQRILQGKFADFEVDVPRDGWEALADRLRDVAPDDGWRGALSEKMASAETPVPRGDWSQVEKRLASRRERRRIVPLWVWNAAEAAAVAAAALLLVALPVAKYVAVPDDAFAPMYGEAQLMPVAADSTAVSAASNEPLAANRPAWLDARPFVAQTVPIEPQPERLVAENANLAEEPMDAAEPDSATFAPDGILAETTATRQIDMDEAERIMADRQRRFAESLATDTLAENRGKKAKNDADDSAVAPSSARVNVGVLASLTPNMSKIMYLSSTSIGGAQVGTRSTARTVSRHDLPFTVGLSVGIPLYERLDLQTGLNYSYAHSTFNKSDRLRGITTERSQQLHYLGVPLMLSYRIVDRQVVKFYVSLGGACEKGLVADQHVQRLNVDGVLLSDETTHEYIEGVQGSLTANVGLGLCFYKGMSLYFEPGFTWYIPSTNYPQPANARTERPYNLSLTAGLRFNVK